MLLCGPRLITNRPCGNIIQDNNIELAPRRLPPVIAPPMLVGVYNRRRIYYFLRIVCLGIGKATRYDNIIYMFGKYDIYIYIYIYIYIISTRTGWCRKAFLQSKVSRGVHNFESKFGMIALFIWAVNGCFCGKKQRQDDLLIQVMNLARKWKLNTMIVGFCDWMQKSYACNMPIIIFKYNRSHINMAVVICVSVSWLTWSKEWCYIS